MGLLGIGKNSNTCQHYKNNFHHKNLAFEKEGNGRQNGTYYGISLESYTYDQDIGVDDDFNHRSLIEVQELKNGFG